MAGAVIRARRTPAKPYIFVLSGLGLSEYVLVLVEIIRTNAADIALFPIVKPVRIAGCSARVIRLLFREKDFHLYALDGTPIDEKLDLLFAEVGVFRRQPDELQLRREKSVADNGFAT